MAATATVTLMLLLLPAADLFAQDGQRWFSIEVSIFSNESAQDRANETWQPERYSLGYPGGLRRLDQLLDLLMIDALQPPAELPEITPADGFQQQQSPQAQANVPLELSPQQQRLAKILATGPFPASEGEGEGEGFRFFDIERDAFLQLPDQFSDFQQTNRSLERAPDHRLLFHALWRQAVVSEAEATPIYVSGGLAYNEQHELQGSLTLHFNDNEDRVVVAANLWLTEFSIVENIETSWQLPSPPEIAQKDLPASDSALLYYPHQVYQMRQSRPMRSGEFHYLDHPALGLVIQVEPYDVPPLPTTEFDVTDELAQ
jgi:hypothetical protein